MHTVIFIGGATASGKSSLAKELNKNIENSGLYRRYQGFADIANLRGINEKSIFQEINSCEVDDWFIKVCSENEVTISDVHYAIQLKRSIEKNESNIDIFQEYVPTISKDLLTKLMSNNIRIIAIYLSCSPGVCYNRAITRYNNKEKELRTKCLEDAIAENNAEYKEWCNIVTSDDIIGITINSEEFTPLELVQQCLEIINLPEKSLALRKTRIQTEDKKGKL